MKGEDIWGESKNNYHNCFICQISYNSSGFKGSLWQIKNREILVGQLWSWLSKDKLLKTNLPCFHLLFTSGWKWNSSIEWRRIKGGNEHNSWFIRSMFQNPVHWLFFAKGEERNYNKFVEIYFEKLQKIIFLR